MKNILFVHQSAELYGSDKTLLVLVTDFKKKGYNPIVVLPNKGPLFEALNKENIPTHILPIIKITRKMFSPGNMLSLPFQVYKAIRILNKSLTDTDVDIIYSNTLAVLIGFLYAKFKKIKHVWHIHEIIEKPNIVRFIFSKLISSGTNNLIIYNSYATQKFWQQNLKIDKSLVVWNGLDKPNIYITPEEIKERRMSYWNADKNDIVIALVGRINRWKGQQLLLSAFSNILKGNKNLRLVFIGSPPPNQDEYLNLLRSEIDNSHLKNYVFILPFQEGIWHYWASIDIAVVPSTEPEPFGLVAIEAMFSKKPVIAAAHGGLTEIVLDKKTGLLFIPNNQVSLEKAIEELIVSKDKMKSLGEEGYIRAMENFTTKHYSDKIEQVCLKLQH